MKKTQYYFVEKTVCRCAGKDNSLNVISIIKGKNVESIIRNSENKEWCIKYKNGDKRIIPYQDFYKDMTDAINSINSGDTNIDNDYMVPVNLQIGKSNHSKSSIIFTIPEEYKNKIDISDETKEVLVKVPTKEIGRDHNRIIITFVPYNVNKISRRTHTISVNTLVSVLDDMIRVIDKYDPNMKDTLLNVQYKIYNLACKTNCEAKYDIKILSVKELIELVNTSNQYNDDILNYSLLIPGYEHKLELYDVSDTDLEILKSAVDRLGILMDSHYYKKEVARIVR